MKKPISGKLLVSREQMYCFGCIPDDESCRKARQSFLPGYLSMLIYAFCSQVERERERERQGRVHELESERERESKLSGRSVTHNRPG